MAADAVKAGLSRCHETANVMVNLLTSYETRLSSLESVMLPIHELTESMSKAHENIQSAENAIDDILAKFDTTASVSVRINEGIGSDLDAYLECMDNIRESMHFFTKNGRFKSSEKALSSLRTLLTVGTRHCEEEFKRILVKQSAPISLMVETGKSKQLQPIDLDSIHSMPSGTIDKAKKLSMRLKWSSAKDRSGGYQQALITCRSDYVLQTLCKLQPQTMKDEGAIEPRSRNSGASSQGMMSPVKGATDGVTDGGILSTPSRYVRGSHRFLFFLRAFLRLQQLEQELVKQLIDERSADGVFTSLMRESLELLLEVVEGILKARKTQDKLFILLDIYHSFVKLKPAEAVGGGSASMRRDIEDLVSQTADALRALYESVEPEVASHPTKSLSNDGTVHEITSNTISYIKRLYDYEDVITLLFKPRSKKSTTTSSSKTKPSEPESESPIIAYILALLNALHTNLEEKARGFRSPTLSYIFLANNLQYILKALRSPPLASALGPKTARAYDAMLQDVLRQYWDASWNRALGALITIELKYKQAGKLAKSCKEILKHAFEGFSTAFEEQSSSQRQYAVPDTDLRTKLIADTKAKVLPPYTAFYNKYVPLNFSKHMEKYVKLSPSQVDDAISKFFSS